MENKQADTYADCPHGARRTMNCGKCDVVKKEHEALFPFGMPRPFLAPGAYTPRDKAFDYKPVHHMELDPKGIDAKAPGAKLDAGKSPVRRGLLEYFPRACLEVAGLSADGAKKYSWGGWASVEGGVDRYGDAEVRHICKAAIEGPVDPDFKRLHATHEAWNALARLELILRQNTVQV